ncbi:MAG: hypothetical protein E7315_06390 [Clostridiales bacterium]|nr:hypothetical protein [Clostridiales bacterium]
MIKMFGKKIHRSWFYVAAASVAIIHIIPLVCKPSPKKRLICSGKKMLCAAEDMVKDWKNNTCSRLMSLFRI